MTYDDSISVCRTRIKNTNKHWEDPDSCYYTVFSLTTPSHRTHLINQNGRDLVSDVRVGVNGLRHTGQEHNFLLIPFCSRLWPKCRIVIKMFRLSVHGRCHRRVRSTYISITTIPMIGIPMNLVFSVRNSSCMYDPWHELCNVCNRV